MVTETDRVINDAKARKISYEHRNEVTACGFKSQSWVRVGNMCTYWWAIVKVEVGKNHEVVGWSVL